MRGIQIPCLEYYLVILLTAAAHVSSRHSCPQDVAGDTGECMVTYNSLMENLDMQTQTFFTGVDPETIRLICDTLVRTLHCANDIRLRCPESEHAVVESIVGEAITVLEMCSIVDLYEMYARHQNCYARESTRSLQCYQTFQTNTGPIMDSVIAGDTAARQIMCNQFWPLVECIQSNVKAQCDSEASVLVEYLVKPSIPKSDQCVNEIQTTLAPTTTTKKSRVQSTANEVGYNRVNSASSHRRKWHVITWSCILLAIALHGYRQ